MKDSRISQRALNTPASAIRKLVPLADAAKKKGIKVYHVNIGQPDLPTPNEIITGIRRFPDKTLEYAPSTGIEKAVSAWRVFYENKGFKFENKDIIITSGGSEGLIFAFFSVADPGDEILLFEPFYTSYSIIAAMGNIRIKAVRTYASDGFHLPKKEAIEAKISKKTKAVLLCNPNNPTGTLYSDSEVKMIVDIAKKHNLFIISDETYQEIVFDNKKVLPLAGFESIADKLIIVDSVSKRFNSCGARVGAVVCKNNELMSCILRFAQSRLSVATVEQLAVIPLLVNHRKYVSEIRDIYQKRRDVVLKELSKINGAEFSVSEGAFYIIPKLPIDDSDKFAEYLLTDFSDNLETVMVAPATGFYASKNQGKDEIRIAYVLEEKRLERAMELLRLAIDSYNG